MSWLTLLQEAVAATNKKAVADEIGVSRTVVSLVMNGKYPAKTDKIAERVMAIYSRVECPHLQRSITKTQCASYHNANAPTSSPNAMRHWKACQSCPNKGAKK